jgi:hypothetical protein
MPELLLHPYRLMIHHIGEGDSCQEVSAGQVDLSKTDSVDLIARPVEEIEGPCNA